MEVRHTGRKGPRSQSLPSIGTPAVSPRLRDDTDIAESIAQRLAWSSTLSKTDVKAEVSDRAVTLRGSWRGSSNAERAARLARNVLGVRNVFDLVTIKPLSTPATSR